MTTRKVRSRRQPSLPGFPDIPDKLDVQIPDDPQWKQIGGDVDLSGHGGTLARTDTSSLGRQIELLEIQPVREYVGESEAAEVGFPFWTREVSYTLEDLDLKNEEVRSAMASSGFDEGDQKYWFEEEATPEQRAIVIAEALMRYGTNVEEGPAGWSKDMPNIEIIPSYGNKIVNLRDYLSDEDDEFRDNVLNYSEIRENIEAEVQKMVDESAAQGWSQLGDQLMMDLEEEGYDDQSAYVIAAFGDEPMIAVNTDTTFGEDFARTIGVSSKDNIYIWSDIGTQQLESWLSKNGYEVVPKFGGDVPTVEGYATARFVIEAVARDMEIDKDVVADAAEGIDWWPEDRGQGDQEIPGESSGDVTVWAKPLQKDEDEEVEEAPRRQRRR